MRTRTPIIMAALAVAVVPGLLIYGLARTSLYGAIVKFLGTPLVLGVGIVILVALLGTALFALIYGFAQDDPVLDRRRARHHFRRWRRADERLRSM